MADKFLVRQALPDDLRYRQIKTFRVRLQFAVRVFPMVVAKRLLIQIAEQVEQEFYALSWNPNGPGPHPSVYRLAATVEELLRRLKLNG
jgi:hypothetical protein